MNRDLLIIGPGSLGRLVAKEWHSLYPDARITGETRSTTSHSQLRQENIQPACVGDVTEVPPFVLFCAPATSDKQYGEEVARAVGRAPAHSRLIFTSSGSVCGLVEKPVDEDTPAATTGRSSILAEAERVTLTHPNAAVIRLSGLFSIDRAAHATLLSMPVFPFPGKTELNLIHYKDAAHAVVLALQLSDAGLAALEKHIFVVAAEGSVSVSQVCEIGVKHPKFQHLRPPIFMDGPDPGWKNYDSTWTRKTLNWSPKWNSYEEFMQQDAERHAQQ